MERYLVELTTRQITPFVVLADSEAEAQEKALRCEVEPGTPSYSEPEISTCKPLGV
ncbi:hypothetical protein [Gilvimarinus sp. DA14]|uniref:hypothetical protein n=1 Tax=Gilvimarinus sp. DA14 TaxID=2956798 RepID=UPI0020B71AF4|nr:hypothetical protein [Gilvimarinus sp. DA14]UTF60277.1 hypothetical protein NHM04_00345 [Gilvimarinus sp. DA14]